MMESKFKQGLKKDLKKLFPGCIIIPGDANSIQGIPDMTILYGKHWASLEGKQEADSKKQPNQSYYVDKMNKMSFSRFIYPENKEEVLDELQQTFGSRRTTRLPRGE